MKTKYTGFAGMTPLLVGLALAALALPLSSAAGAEPAAAGAREGGNHALESFKVAMVPALNATPYYYAEQRGYYREAGLDVTLSTNDSGPAVVTGVLNGTYDAALSAALPVLIAVSKGAGLIILPGTSIVHEGAENSGLVVRKGSPIEGYKDLVGKTVATNALTSLNVLAMKLGMKNAGVNPEQVKFIALPFKTSLQAVARGQADAAVVISPLVTEAAMNGMQVIGDPIGTNMPKGSPYNIVFTSARTWKEKASQFRAFEKATVRAIAELQANPALQRKLAVSITGLKPDVAQRVPLPGYTSGGIDMQAFQKYADDAAEFGFTSKPVDVAKVTVAP